MITEIEELYMFISTVICIRRLCVSHSTFGQACRPINTLFRLCYTKIICLPLVPTCFFSHFPETILHCDTSCPDMEMKATSGQTTAVLRKAPHALVDITRPLGCAVHVTSNKQNAYSPEDCCLASLWSHQLGVRRGVARVCHRKLRV